MQLRPNPPRLITVAVAILLAVIGVILAWPVEPGMQLLEPIAAVARSVGLPLDARTGYLALFASSALLVAGSLLRGI